MTAFPEFPIGQRATKRVLFLSTMNWYANAKKRMTIKRRPDFSTLVPVSTGSTTGAVGVTSRLGIASESLVSRQEGGPRSTKGCIASPKRVRPRDFLDKGKKRAKVSTDVLALSRFVDLPSEFKR